MFVLLAALAALVSFAMMGPGGGRRPGGRGPGGGRGGPGGGGMGGRPPRWRMPLVLLGSAGLHEELGLGDEQKRQVKDALARLGERLKGSGQALQGLEGAVRREKLQALIRDTAEAARQAVFPLLRPEQQRRVQEIQLQMQGLQAFADPAVQAALHLRPEQISQLQSLAEALRQEAQGQPGEGKGNPQQMRARMAEQRKVALEKAVALMSDEQKSMWRQLIGAPYQSHRAAGGAEAAEEDSLLGFDGDF
jgi:hypothetical protein